MQLLKFTKLWVWAIVLLGCANTAPLPRVNIDHRYRYVSDVMKANNQTGFSDAASHILNLNEKSVAAAINFGTEILVKGISVAAD